MRQITMSLEEVETPIDLQDGELVEAIRLGGPRDGDTIGFFEVQRIGDEITLNPKPRGLGT